MQYEIVVIDAVRTLVALFFEYLVVDIAVMCSCDILTFAAMSRLISSVFVVFSCFFLLCKSMNGC
jgi:hypothetical protein